MHDNILITEKWHNCPTTHFLKIVNNYCGINLKCTILWVGAAAAGGGGGG